MRDFLAAQQRREEGLLAEIRGLSLSIGSPVASTCCSATSKGCPATTCVESAGCHYHTQHSNSPHQHPGVFRGTYHQRRHQHHPSSFQRQAVVPLLARKALEAYTAMDEEWAHWYPDLKTALLAKFNISPETYRQQFRSMTIPPGENLTYHRLKGLYRRWIRPEQHTKEQIGETIILPHSCKSSVAVSQHLERGPSFMLHQCSTPTNIPATTALAQEERI
ncbi:hypothetical protein D5F01_LYC19116 [Larimichthys crocea]|uniref:SCAN box domain-containing protein n=1 Tax=Larimichthys crocea TaxID=215358 RepID=A0A6G0HXH2_LARCR|nr:hypothetical protein D5F01_LYC19116 [Larimichthys crocea]